MDPFGFVLAFFLCVRDPATDWESCDEGIVVARSCEAGEAYIKVGLRPDQEFWPMRCWRASSRGGPSASEAPSASDAPASSVRP